MSRVNIFRPQILIIYFQDAVFNSTLSSWEVVPHPSSMIYEKVVIFDSTLSSQKVVPHPSSRFVAAP